MAIRIGLIGCGNISDIYLTNAKLFRDIEFSAVSDLKSEAAQRQSEKYGVPRRGVDELLGSDDVDVVLNLTIPAAHAEVSQRAVEAGKHIYSEKPLATEVEAGRRLLASARERNVRVGGAPDTVLGASIQAARAMIDEGVIGRPLLGLSSFLSHGMEHWHPNPDFFFQPGGGPVFDMGPYYVTTLVQLLGPVRSVMASGQAGFEERTVTAEASPVKGSRIKVEVLTTLQAILEFEGGAQVTFLASWDVWKHGLRPMELHGTLGSMRVPDPNWFGGTIEVARERGEWEPTPTEDRTYGKINYPFAGPLHANYRGLGLADMARGILDQRPHRANGDVAQHALGVMAAILEAAREGRRVDVADTCERPPILGEEEAAGLLA